MSYQKRWTKFRRAQKSEKIQKVKPWLRSTGPKTASGKARSAMNAVTEWAAAEPLFSAMKAQKRFIRSIRIYSRMIFHGLLPPDSLTDRLCAQAQAVLSDLTLGLAVYQRFQECNRAQQ